MQTVTPFLWYDGQAEEAAALYTSALPGSEIVEVRRRPGAGPGEGAMSVTFRLAGQPYIAFNGGPHFTFSPAISLFVRCETQAEVDALWGRLGAGGKEQRCGWLTDRFGVSWQIVPRVLGEMLADPDPARAKRTFEAMMGMVKLDIAGLQRAYDGA